MQKKRHSLLEAIANALSGFGLAWLMNLYLLPWWGLHPNPAQSLQITMAFTVISVVRGYLWRRLFNRHTTLRAGFDLPIAPFERGDANTLYWQATDEEGKVIIKHIRSTFEPHDDALILDKSLEFKYAARRQNKRLVIELAEQL